jgi:hypothetical protein
MIKYTLRQGQLQEKNSGLQNKRKQAAKSESLLQASEVQFRENRAACHNGG